MTMAVTVRVAVSEDLPRLVEMWAALYDHQRDHGMLLPLADAAADRWGRSITEKLDTPIARVIVADVDGVPVGFITCQIKRLPPMYHPSVGKSATILEMWVDHTFRSHGTGARLVEAAEEWFRASGVRTAELQVVIDNPGGLKFWKARGWAPECYQLRRTLS